MKQRNKKIQAHSMTTDLTLGRMGRGTRIIGIRVMVFPLQIIANQSKNRREKMNPHVVS